MKRIYTVHDFLDYLAITDKPPKQITCGFDGLLRRMSPACSQDYYKYTLVNYKDGFDYCEARNQPSELPKLSDFIATLTTDEILYKSVISVDEMPADWDKLTDKEQHWIEVYIRNVGYTASDIQSIKRHVVKDECWLAITVADNKEYDIDVNDDQFVGLVAEDEDES